MSTVTMALIRHLLTFIGGSLITLGWLDEATVQALIGAGTTLVGILWSFWDKKETAVTLAKLENTSGNGY